jgi:hypothetical protein
MSTVEQSASVQSPIGRLYTPSLLDNASNTDFDSFFKNSMDSDVHLKECISLRCCSQVCIAGWWGLCCRLVLQLDLLASSIMKGDMNENTIVKSPSLYDPVCMISFICIQCILNDFHLICGSIRKNQNVLMVLYVLIYLKALLRPLKTIKWSLELLF